jgi:hypothetical protein
MRKWRKKHICPAWLQNEFPVLYIGCIVLYLSRTFFWFRYI